MTATSSETTEAHRARVRGRILVVFALALLGGAGLSHAATPRGPSTHLGAGNDPLTARLARSCVHPVREVRDGDPACAGLAGLRTPQRPEQLHIAWLRGPMPVAELPDGDRTWLRHHAAQPWPADTGDADAALAGAWRRSSPDERAPSLRAAFAAVVARRGPPLRAGSRAP